MPSLAPQGVYYSVLVVVARFTEGRPHRRFVLDIQGMWLTPRACSRIPCTWVNTNWQQERFWLSRSRSAASPLAPTLPERLKLPLRALHVTAAVESAETEQEMEQQQTGDPERGEDKELMAESYGSGYATRSSEEGFGQIYSEAAQRYKSRPEPRPQGVALQPKDGEEASVDMEPGVMPPDFDVDQGHPVSQKEHGRNSMKSHNS